MAATACGARTNGGRLTFGVVATGALVLADVDELVELPQPANSRSGVSPRRRRVFKTRAPYRVAFRAVDQLVEGDRRTARVIDARQLLSRAAGRYSRARGRSGTHAWLSFFKLFSEMNTEDKIRTTLGRMSAGAAKKKKPARQTTLDGLRVELEAVVGLLSEL